MLGGRRNYPMAIYPEFVQTSEDDWLNSAEAAINDLNKLPKAKLVQFQSIDPFNSFYPMEVIATEKEVNDLINENPEPGYLLFPEIRENSIRMTNDIPAKWIEDGITNKFSGKALKGEYFTFQIGCFAAQKEIENITVEFSGLSKNGQVVVDASECTCFNTEGVDWEGKHFKKNLNIEKGKVQALWIGIQVPEEIEAGEYGCLVKVKPSNMQETDVLVKLTVSEFSVSASGDNEPERLSRLHWLNSTIAEDDEIVAPYTALQVVGNTVNFLGCEVTFGENGFPESIQSFYSESVTKIQDIGTEILSAPINFVVETKEEKLEWTNPSFKKIKQEEGAVAWEIKLDIDWNKINIKKQGAKLTAPEIKGFQGGAIYDLNQPFTVPGGKGFLLILK